MAAMNVVRMRVKAGREPAFLKFHEDRAIEPLKGMRSLRLVKTGEREYLVLGDWENMDALVAARPAMIAMLDSFREASTAPGPTRATAATTSMIWVAGSASPIRDPAKSS